MPTLEQALTQMNYWKGVVESERKKHSDAITEMTRQLSDMTKAVNEGERLVTFWKNKYNELKGTTDAERQEARAKETTTENQPGGKRHSELHPRAGEAEG
jgi:hypothetical protein